MAYPNYGFQPYQQPYQNAFTAPQTAPQPQFQPTMMQTPTYQQMTAYKPLQGRVVQSESEIMPNDVLNDGTTCLFPTSDYSRIFAKRFNGDGTISTVSYVPDVSEPQEVEATPTFADVVNQVSNLQSIVEGLQAAIPTASEIAAEVADLTKPKPTRTTTKKAGE